MPLRIIRLWKCIKWAIIVNSLKTIIVFYEIISNDNDVWPSLPIKRWTSIYLTVSVNDYAVFLTFCSPQWPKHEQHHWASSICIQGLPLSGRTVSTCLLFPLSMKYLLSAMLTWGPGLMIRTWVFEFVLQSSQHRCTTCPSSQRKKISKALREVTNHSPLMSWTRAVIQVQ